MVSRMCRHTPRGFGGKHEQVCRHRQTAAPLLARSPAQVPTPGRRPLQIRGLHAVERTPSAPGAPNRRPLNYPSSATTPGNHHAHRTGFPPPPSRRKLNPRKSRPFKRLFAPSSNSLLYLPPPSLLPTNPFPLCVEFAQTVSSHGTRPQVRRLRLPHHGARRGAGASRAPEARGAGPGPSAPDAARG